MRSRLVFRLPGRVLLAAVCALAAHAAAYRTLWPKDGVHGYMSWYEPLVAGVSLAAICTLLILGALVLVARRHGRRLRPPGGPFAARPLDARIMRIAGSGLLYLVVQESFERSVAGGTPQFASLAASQWLVVFACLGAAALVLALALQLGEIVVEAALREPAAPVERRSAPAWSVTVGELRRSRPLALRSGLRAPPALSPT